MGEQMSKEAGGDHGHSHSGGAGHGHSHGGQPCHGHGGAAAAAPKPSAGGHGHSHSGGHGHSHGGGGHGHSHGGQPCHGHGGASQVPPIVQKRSKVAEVFLKVVLLKLLPGLFANYHTPTSEEAAAVLERENARQLETLKLAESGEGDAEVLTKTVSNMINDNSDQSMTREEFRKFLVITRCAGSAAYGYPVTKTREVAMMEAQILARAGFDLRDPKVEVRIPQKLFLQIAAMLVRQVCITSPESLPTLMKMWGLDVTIPNLFIEPERAQIAEAMVYARDNLAGAILAYIEAKREENKDSKEPHVRTGFYGFMQSLIKGLEEANSSVEDTKEMLAMFRMTPYEQMLEEFKQDPADDDIEPKLLVNQAIQTVVAPLLLQDPQAMQHVAAQWGVEMNLVDDAEEAGEGHGHSHGGVPCHGHGAATEPTEAKAAEEAHGHSHGGAPCHGHGHGHGHSHE